MNTKDYIERFDEISHLSRAQQFDILEQVKDEIQSSSALLSFTAITFIVRVSCMLILLGASYIFWEPSTWTLFLAVFLGLIVSRVLVTEIKDHIVLKGLKNILNKNVV
ncbi:hypothetical protein HII17_18105 [Thalassotalea sp. M1531]|uniref:Uncharacterized protein n=1 Tax=Thalassotalea algicola TaxID=2716224 RepID=A0A7Y0LFT2_9GAMM|nr:hypothetical protein [Thalassotalea algicola]NMP33464.1 hypothetical protein [Thalassotalea algicola]